MLIRFIQGNQGHRDSVMHEFHSNVNKVNKTVAEVRTIGDRLPLTLRQYNHDCFDCQGNARVDFYRDRLLHTPGD